MIRRRVIAGLAGGLWPATSARAQARVFRVGLVVTGPDAAPGGFLFDALRRGFQERGYREGVNLQIEYRLQAHSDRQGLPAAAAEIVALKPDVIVTSTSPPTKAVRDATKTIPVVMVATGDPVGSGFVASVARPGSNVTGLSVNTAEIVGKQAALLREFVPDAKRVAFLWNALNPANLKTLESATAELPGRLGFEVIPLSFSLPEELPTLFDDPARDKMIDAVVIVADGTAYVHRRIVADAATRNRLPSIFTFKEEAADGGLAAYGTDLPDLYYRAAGYVDQILKGADPARIPVQFPTRYSFVLNLRTAKSLGLSIGPGILARADEVIE